MPISSGKFSNPSKGPARGFLNLLFLKIEQRGRSHRAINLLKYDFCGGSRGGSVFVKPLKFKLGTCSHQKLEMLTTIQRPLETSPCVKHAIFITAGFTRQGRNTSNYNSNEINILILLLFSRFRRQRCFFVVQVFKIPRRGHTVSGGLCFLCPASMSALSC